MTMQPTDDDGLVALAQAGDTLAFEALVRRHQTYVYNLALRVLANPEDAADLAQQAFVRAWQALPGFRGEARFSTWLYRIVTNLCYNRLPRLRRDLASLDADDEALELPEAQPGPEDTLVRAAQRRQIQEAFAALPEGYRLLVTLRHLQDMTYDDIAQATGLPLGTVKTGLFRARRLLRQTLLDGEHEYG